MRQPDLLEELREARPLPPAELREHVRRIAARATPAPPSRRPRLTWRRVLVVAVPVAAAGIAAAALLPGGVSPTARPGQPLQGEAAVPPSTAAAAASGAQTTAPSAPGSRAALPTPSPSRVQRYTATLQLRVPGTRAVSDGTKQAVQIAGSLGGYASSVNVNATGHTGYATIVLRIPKAHVQRAVTRLSALGTIVGENVSIQDLQAQVDATARKIARLKQQLAGWQGQPASDETRKHIAALTAQIDRLERGRAATIRSAGLATIHLQLTTPSAPVVEPPRPGPLHGLSVAFRWAGIGAVYALALGAPLALLAALAWLAARAVHRRREQTLLSRP